MTLEELHSQGLKFFREKNFDAALKIADKLQKIAPKYKQGYYLEASVWRNLSNPVKEYYAFEKLLPLLDFSSAQGRKFAAETFARIANACVDLGLLKESLDFNAIAGKLIDNPQKEYGITSISVFRMNFLENVSSADFHAIYAEYEKFLSNIVPYQKKIYAHKKIRVGFLSGNFKFHPMISWAWALLSKLDRNLFKIYCYSNLRTADNFTERLCKTADVWRDIYDLTDEAAAEIIRDDEIDILFDLDGHTGNNRLRLMAYRPATVQISGIGYMNSTGLDCVDYFFSDVYCAGDENFFTEKVIKLPHSHICYEPFTNIDPADAPPCLKNGFVTFGSFNRFGKITDSMLTTWKKILDAVPESRLILKNSLLQTNDGKKFVGERLKSFGFELNRVEMRPFGGNHLVEYGDIALDTFPYTGGVTTCEALYMGVPVVSLYGSRHGTRFGLSILKNVGLEELAVATYDEYIDRAIMLAGDWELLTILRKNLRTMMKKSPLMDSQNYIREVEEIFIKLGAFNF